MMRTVVIPIGDSLAKQIEENDEIMEPFMQRMFAETLASFQSEEVQRIFQENLRGDADPNKRVKGILGD